MNKSVMGFIDTYNEINVIYSKKVNYYKRENLKPLLQSVELSKRGIF